LEKLSLLENKADILAAYRALDHIIIWSAGVSLCFDERPLVDLENRVKMARARSPATAKVLERQKRLQPIVEKAASQLGDMPREKLPTKIMKDLMRDTAFRARFPEALRVILSDVRTILPPEFPEDEEE
jgi:hypothetical protein